MSPPYGRSTSPRIASSNESGAPESGPLWITRITHTGAWAPWVEKRSTFPADHPAPNPSGSSEKYGSPVAGLIGAVVLPEFRGRGVYRALIGARARDTLAGGRTLLTCQARAQTSAPILLGLGFHEVCRMESLAFS